MQAHFRWVIAALLLFPVCVLGAEPKAVIDGVDKAVPGDLVVLRTKGSVGTGFAWNVVPKWATKHSVVVEGGTTCIFASSRKGKFTFILSATDTGTSTIATAQHELYNGLDPPDDDDPPPDDDIPPDDEDPQPGDNWANWAKKTAEAKVDMPCGGPRANAAKAIASALDDTVKVCAGSSLTLQECREILARKTSAAVTPEVQTKWHGFSIEMDRKIRAVEQSNLSVDNWCAIIQSIAKGLRTVR